MIYVHVPFCKSFCTYCDFYSEIPEGGLFERYTAQVCAEIRRRTEEMDDELKTLYFGGGTPSVLPLAHLTRILLAGTAVPARNLPWRPIRKTSWKKAFPTWKAFASWASTG